MHYRDLIALPVLCHRAIPGRLWGNVQRCILYPQRAQCGRRTPHWAKRNYRPFVDADWICCLKWLFGYSAVKLAEGSRLIHSGIVCTSSECPLFVSVASLFSDSCWWKVLSTKTQRFWNANSASVGAEKPRLETHQSIRPTFGCSFNQHQSTQNHRQAHCFYITSYYSPSSSKQ